MPDRLIMGYTDIIAARATRPRQYAGGPLARTAAVLALLIVQTAADPGAAARAATEVLGEVKTGVEYRTNPRHARSSSKEEDATALAVDLRLPVKWHTERWELNLRPRLDYRYFTKSTNDDLDERDKYLEGDGLFQTARSQFGFSTGLTDTSIRTSALNPDGSGRSDDGTQERWYVNPYLALNVSERDTLQVGGGYNDIRYRNNIDPRYDYENGYVTATLQRQLNAKNSISLQGTMSRFDSVEPVSTVENDSRTNNMALIYGHRFSATLQSEVNIGWARTRSTVTRPNFFNFFFGYLCDPALTRCETRSSGSNFVGDLSLTSFTERTSVKISINQRITPNSNGSEVVQTSVAGNLSRYLTRNLLAFVDVNGFKQRDTGDGANRDRDYVSFIARLEWEFRRRWWLGTQYRFIYDEQTDFSGNDLGSYQDHRLLMTVKYRTLPWGR